MSAIRDMRLLISASVLLVLIAMLLRCATGCGPAKCSDLYTPGDTIKVAFARMGTLFNGTDEVESEVLTCFHWQGIVPVDVGTFTEVAVADSGVAGFYFVTDSTDIGQYFASWQGTIQGRTPVSVYNFEVEGPPTGPNKVNLWFLDSSDSSGIQDVWVKIMDEDQIATHQISYSNSSGLLTTALPADTAQVIPWKGGQYTFTVPTEVVVTSSGLTDTIFGTPVSAASADSANTTCVEGRLRALDATESEDVIVKAEVLSGEDLGSPASNPSYLVVRQAVMDTTDSGGYFKLCLFSSDELLPEGGSAGIWYKFSFSKDVRIGPRWISDSDSLYLPSDAGTYQYWDTDLRP